MDIFYCTFIISFFLYWIYCELLVYHITSRKKFVKETSIFQILFLICIVILELLKKKLIHQSNLSLLFLWVTILYIANLIIIGYGLLVSGGLVFCLPIDIFLKKKGNNWREKFKTKYKIWRENPKKWYWFILLTLVWSIVPIYVAKIIFKQLFSYK